MWNAAIFSIFSFADISEGGAKAAKVVALLIAYKDTTYNRNLQI
jgi:hypothetical protein